MARVPRSSGLPVALSAPRHGDFPRSISGSKLPVCSLRGHAFPALKEICEVKCNLQTTSCAKLQRQSSNVIANMNLLPIQSSYKQPRARPAFNLCIAQSVSRLLALLDCESRKHMKTGFEVCLCQTSVGRGHGKSEPRSVGVLANAHGMTLLLQRTKTPEPQLH